MQQFFTTQDSYLKLDCSFSLFLANDKKNLLLLINDPAKFFENLRVFNLKVQGADQQTGKGIEQIGKIIDQAIKKEYSPEDYENFLVFIANWSVYRVENWDVGLNTLLLKISYYKGLHPQPSIKNLKTLEDFYRQASEKNLKLNYNNPLYYEVSQELLKQQLEVVGEILKLLQPLSKIPTLQSTTEN